MNDCFIKKITLRGFLSFAPRGIELPMESLNVLIGPNGSGKSNLIEAFAVLRAVPKDLPLPIRQGGGVRDWLYVGQDQADQADQAEIDVVFGAGHLPSSQRRAPARSVRYRLAFGEEGNRFVVLDETVESESPGPGHPEPFRFFSYNNGHPYLSIVNDTNRRALRREDIDPEQSILAQRRDPDSYPEITGLAEKLGKITVYRDWSFGPNSAPRSSSRMDARADMLSESFDNLPTRLSALKGNPAVKRALLDHLSDIAPGFVDLEVVPEGGRLQLYLTEGSHNIPAHRLSDGTLRYLCLLAILLDPKPGPLVVLEEPELGLHFDLMNKIADLLRQASTRTQLVVTTHSDILVDALSDTPESVVVCEKGADGTSLVRLQSPNTAKALTEHSLGSRWTRGELGGTRW